MRNLITILLLAAVSSNQFVKGNVATDSEDGGAGSVETDDTRGRTTEAAGGVGRRRLQLQNRGSLDHAIFLLGSGVIRGLETVENIAKRKKTTFLSGRGGSRGQEEEGELEAGRTEAAADGRKDVAGGEDNSVRWKIVETEDRSGDGEAGGLTESATGRREEAATSKFSSVRYLDGRPATSPPTSVFLSKLVLGRDTASRGPAARTAEGKRGRITEGSKVSAEDNSVYSLIAGLRQDGCTRITQETGERCSEEIVCQARNQLVCEPVTRQLCRKESLCEGVPVCTAVRRAECTGEAGNRDCTTTVVLECTSDESVCGETNSCTDVTEEDCRVEERRECVPTPTCSEYKYLVSKNLCTKN